MRILKALQTPLLVGVLGIFAGNALAGDGQVCLTGTLSSEQQRVDCAGRWISADGTRFGPRITPRETYETSRLGHNHDAASAAGYARTHTGTTYYSTHASGTAPSVWTPPDPDYPDTGYQTSPYQYSGQYPGEIVISRGHHSNTHGSNTHGSSYGYDIYVPTRLSGRAEHHQDPSYDAYGPSCHDHSRTHHGTHSACAMFSDALPEDRCFIVHDGGHARPIPCPQRDAHGHDETHAHTSTHADASAHASASASTGNVGFYNTLSGGVGGGISVFYGGGGGASFSGGGGSVLSRASLIRFGGHNRGHRKGGGGGGGHGGCKCGGSMMGMGGGH